MRKNPEVDEVVPYMRALQIGDYFKRFTMLRMLAFGCLLVFGPVVYAQVIDLPCGVDIVVILDISCSITPANKTLVHSFMESFGGALDIGPADDKVQLGLITFDKFVYSEFYLNTYKNSADVVKHISQMDIHPENDHKPRCGTRTDLALREAKTVQLTSAKGVRDTLGLKSPPIQKVVLVITDGATFPPSKAGDTKKEAAALKRESGANVFVVSLPNIKNKDGTAEFSAIASQPTSEFLLNIGFDKLLGSLETILLKFCVLPEPEPTNETISDDPCERFKSFQRRCPITMSMCHVSDKRCCGCPLMFMDPTTKQIKSPFELAYKEGKCICEPCVRRSYYCLPKEFREKVKYRSVNMLKLIALGCILALGPVVYGQKIELECGVDIVVILDISCSITPPNKTIVHEFMVGFANALDIGPSPEKAQLGLVTFDKFVYDEFFLNTYKSSSQIANHITNMDIHPDNDNRPRCGTRTDLALRSAKTLHLTSAKGLRDPLGIKNPPIQKVVLVITDGATFPPSKAPDTKKEARALKQDTGAKVFVVSLPNANNKDGTAEFSAIASQPTDDFLIQKGFDELLISLEDILGGFCDPPITEPPKNDTDPCKKFASFQRTCPITMSACHPSNRRCCGCPFMFMDPTSKSMKTPFELAYKEGKCICEECVRRSYYCLPKELRDILGYGKPEVNYFHPSVKRMKP
ncbi:unnamed protein product [Owenia fusiformis]|uniref:VWFA domain-containing protein n=1 Tax=Owenia fusiformis TaxID=6347 RepID=A0A8S4P956_OWEFU|nr:unnamed protein product [Owenia fusiformis]